MTMRIPLLALAAVIGGACTLEVVEDEGSGLEASVSSMMQGSADAWNDGNLDAFVGIYADAATTSFMTLDGPVRGLDSIRAAYAPAFAPGADRDSLRFEHLEVRQLPPLIGVATGKYVLHAGGEVTSNGWFTLVFRRVGSGWSVIHDHSSESPVQEQPESVEVPE